MLVAVIALCVLLDSSLIQEAALLAVQIAKNALMPVPALCVTLDFHLLMEFVFKVLLKEFLQQLLVEFLLYVQLDALAAHLLLSALTASKVSPFKATAAYNAINLAEPALWMLPLSAHHASLVKISTLVSVYHALIVFASTVKTTMSSA